VFLGDRVTVFSDCADRFDRAVLISGHHDARDDRGTAFYLRRPGPFTARRSAKASRAFFSSGR